MRKIILFILLVAVVGSMVSSRRHSGSYIITTATPGGTYYPVGVAIGALVSLKLHSHDVTATAITSAGSGENIHMLHNEEADFAILQALFGALAFRGEGNYEGQPVQDFRAITVLWKNVEHFVLMDRFTETGNIQDLQKLEGRKFSIGKRGSGTEGSGRVILGALGVDVEEDVRLEFLGYNASVQSMIDGRVVGANIPAGVPASAITQLFAQLGSDRVSVLEITDEQLEAVREAYPIWVRYVIPSGSYPGQEEDIYTIAQPNFLACREDLPEETVYQVTKTIFENLNYLRNVHKATQAMSLENALSGLPVRLHPGAERYYREQGLEITERLCSE